MGLDGMDVIFEKATSHKLDAITLFQALSCFKNSKPGWDRHHLQTGNFSKLDVISFSKQFQVLNS